MLKKPSNQDVVVSLLHAISDYFKTVAPAGARSEDIGEILGKADALERCEADTGFQRLVELLPGHSTMVRAMLAMSMLDEPVVNPIFSRTDAVGSVMRKKLKPVSDPLLGLVDILTS